MQKRNDWISHLRNIAFASFLFFDSSFIHAAGPWTWDPMMGINWNTAANWMPNGIPADTETVIFDGAVTPMMSTTNVDLVISPGALFFQNTAMITITGNPLTVGGAGCPQLFFDMSSTATWSVPITLAGPLQLSDTGSGGGGTASFSTMNSSSSSNLTVDQGITCNLTQPIGTWTSSTITVDGILNLSASGALPSNVDVILGNNTSAQFNFAFAGITQTIANLTGGGGMANGSINLPSLNAAPSNLTITNASGTYDGIFIDFIGKSTLDITSPDTYMLSGDNSSFLGAVTLNSGTLQALASNALPYARYSLAAPAVLDCNGTFCRIQLLNGGGTVSLSTMSAGVVSVFAEPNLGSSSVYTGTIIDGGVPGIVQLELGTLYLQGMNTYSGGTVVTGGTLQVDNLGNLGTPNGMVYFLTINGSNSDPTFQPQSALTFNPSPSLGILIGSTATLDTTFGTLTVPVQISGGGRLKKIGTNPLILQGTNVFQGGLELTSGVVQVSDMVNLGSPFNNPLMIFDGGILQPTMPFTVMSSGNNILLQGSGTFDTSLSLLTVSAPISGTGPLIATGDILTLSGMNTYTGQTLVQSGTLVIDAAGSTGTGSVIVSSGATLTGTGPVNGPILASSGGTLQPGNGGISSQPYTAGLNMASGSILTININNAGQTSSANVTGPAVLNGSTLQVIASPGSYARIAYPPFLTSGSVTGSFSPSILGIAPSGLIYSLFYASNFVQLRLVPGMISLSDQSGNNKILAEYLNALPLTSLGAPGLDLLFLLPNQQSSALETISPSRNAEATFNSYNVSFTFSQLVHSRSLQQRYTRVMQRPMLSGMHTPFPEDLLMAFVNKPAQTILADVQEPCVENIPKSCGSNLLGSPSSGSIWFTAFGDLARQKEQNQNPTFHMENSGFLLAGEGCCRDVASSDVNDLGFGGAIGFAHSSIVEEHDFGSSNSNGIYAAFYQSSYFRNHCYLDFSIWGNYQHIDHRRNIFYPVYSTSSTSVHPAWGGDLHTAFGYDYYFDKGEKKRAVEPFLCLDWAFEKESGYTEHGENVYNMHIDSHFSSMLRTEAGVNLFLSWFPKWAIWTFREKLSYVNKVPFGATVTGALVGAPTTFTVTALNSVQNLVAVSGELDMITEVGYYASLLYDLELGSGYLYNQLAVRMGYDF